VRSEPEHFGSGESGGVLVLRPGGVGIGGGFVGGGG
jgi:hypothetical protein